MPTLKHISGHLDHGYGEGPVTVWYMRPEFTRDGCMGVDWLRRYGKLPEPEYLGNIERTHIKLGEVGFDTLNVYEMMQGERWSPNGEARPLIEALGLSHTSMTVGDVIQNGNMFWMVDRLGLALIGGASV